MLLKEQGCLFVKQLSEIDIQRVYSIVSQKYLGTNRLNHILGVVKMSNFLAGIYNVDKTKTTIAALVHDYFKYESKEELMSLIENKEDLEEALNIPVLLHSYASAESLKKVFGIQDEEIYNAIKFHVFGRMNMSMLEKIILISDYTEENRTYPDCVKCRQILLENGIDEAILFSTEKTIEHVLKSKEKVSPKQYQILKEFKEKVKK